MAAYRVVVVSNDSARSVTTLVVQLDRDPDVGSTFELPHGESVIVRHVVSGHQDGLAAVILAAPGREGAG